MFWTEWDVEEAYTKSSITRANMDGTDVQRIRYENIYWPNALTVDYIKNKLYYVDAKKGLIEYSDLGKSYPFYLHVVSFLMDVAFSRFNSEI